MLHFCLLLDGIPRRRGIYKHSFGVKKTRSPRRRPAVHPPHRRRRRPSRNMTLPVSSSAFVCGEPRAASREPRAASREPRAASREPRTAPGVPDEAKRHGRRLGRPLDGRRLGRPLDGHRPSQRARVPGCARHTMRRHHDPPPTHTTHDGTKKERDTQHTAPEQYNKPPPQQPHRLNRERC